MAIRRDYHPGELLRIKVECKVGSVFTDPTTGPTFKYKPPTGSVVTKVYLTDVDIIRESAGKFYYDLTLSLEGKYYLRWEAVGVVTGADEEHVRVKLSEFV